MEKQPFISRQVTIGELIGSIVTIAIVLISSYISIDKRITILEQEYVHEKEFRQEIKSELNDIKKGQETILIKLENKQNRLDYETK